MMIASQIHVKFGTNEISVFKTFFFNLSLKLLSHIFPVFTIFKSHC